MSETDKVLTPSGELLLDPFSYHPRETSAIRGLGGDIKPQDPTYALHTDYVRVAEGPASFILRFQGLAAKTGTLQLRVHMFVEGPPARFLLANTVRVQFNRLIQLGSELSVRFEGIKGVQFALHGAVLGDSDAVATGLSIALDRPATDDDAGEGGGSDLRNTDFGLHTTRAVPMLHAVERPTLVNPVGQLATRSQLAEQPFVEWRDRLDLDVANDRDAWAAAYVMQVLRSYGVLQDGARGVGFGVNAAAVATGIQGFDAIAEPAELPDLPERLPGELVDFDFLWSIDAVIASGVIESLNYVESLMRCLRPGGLAVHVVPFLPGRLQRHDDPPATAYRRGEIERLSIFMIGRMCEVAQLKIDDADPLYGSPPDGPDQVGAFGMIFRKAPLSG